VRARTLIVTLMTVAGCGSTPAPVDGGSSTPDTSVGPRDAGPDANIQIDSGPSDCLEGYASCTLVMATDDTMVTEPITVSVIGGTLADPAFRYDNPCIRIRAGMSVTIENSATHPLRAASCSPADSPILAAPTGTTFRFDHAGHYGYYCQNHGTNAGLHMAGMIIVD